MKTKGKREGKKDEKGRRRRKKEEGKNLKKGGDARTRTAVKRRLRPSK
jgi:hypothetical protein